jgi:hypothetical protein
MPITFSCECGKQLKVGDQFAGKRAKRPACNAVVQVPAVEPVEELMPDPEPPPPPVMKPPAPPPPRHRVREDDNAPTFRVQGDDDEDDRPRKRKYSADDEEDRPRKRKKRIRDDDEPPARGGGISISGGMIGGLVMMGLAVVWFVLGWQAGRIFFYPPILFIFGLIAVIKGFLGYSED